MALAIGEELTAACVPIRVLSTAALENQSIEQKQNHCAYDRHNPAGDVITARKDATDPGAYERARYAEQNRNDATAGIFSRHQQFRDGADNKTDHQSPKNRMCAEVHMRRSSMELIV
jgi:hypothetical protein